MWEIVHYYKTVLLRAKELALNETRLYTSRCRQSDIRRRGKSLSGLGFVPCMYAWGIGTLFRRITNQAIKYKYPEARQSSD